jgi:hypothetical protein
VIAEPARTQHPAAHALTRASAGWCSEERGLLAACCCCDWVVGPALLTWFMARTWLMNGGPLLPPVAGGAEGSLGRLREDREPLGGRVVGTMTELLPKGPSLLLVLAWDPTCMVLCSTPCPMSPWYCSALRALHTRGCLPCMNRDTWAEQGCSEGSSETELSSNACSQAHAISHPSPPVICKTCWSAPFS